MSVHPRRPRCASPGTREHSDMRSGSRILAGRSRGARRPHDPARHSLQARKPTLPAARPTIALALGGGGARGLAHILMLEVFDELGLKPKVIAGTSIGAVVRRRLCLGAVGQADPGARRGGAEPALRHLPASCSRRGPSRCCKFLNFLPIRSSLLKPELLLDLMLPSKVARDFAHLAHPAQDRGHRLLCPGAGGPESRALCAARSPPAWRCRPCSRPSPVDGRVLMDGGLVNPLPFDVLQGRRRHHRRHRRQRRPPGPGKRSAAHPPSPRWSSSSQIMQRSIVREKLKAQQPDIYIDVEVDEFYVLDFHRFKQILAAAGRPRSSSGASSNACWPARPLETLPADRLQRSEPSTAGAKRLPGLKRLARRRSAMTGDPPGDRSHGVGHRASRWRSAADRPAGWPTSLMLEVFDELGIKPAIIAGTSMGAICGAAYAAGLSARRDPRTSSKALFANRRHVLQAVRRQAARRHFHALERCAHPASSTTSRCSRCCCRRRCTAISTPSRSRSSPSPPISTPSSRSCSIMAR